MVKKAETAKAVKKEVKVKKTAKKIETKVEEAKKTVNSEGDKQAVIKSFAITSGDTGSPEVQVAILTWKIFRLQQHLRDNPKDNHSRRGLLKIVSKRRRIMNYLKKKDKNRYEALEKKIQSFSKS